MYLATWDARRIFEFTYHKIQQNKAEMGTPWESAV